MKNKISILLLLTTLLYIAPAKSQQAMKATIPSTVLGNPSGVNSASSNGVTAVYLYVHPTLPYKQAAFSVKSVRVSTGQNGNAMLQGSVDGINYIALSTTDSIHISNAATDYGDRYITLNSTSTAYPSNGVVFPYYRLKFVQIAGDTATVSGYFFGRQ